MDLNPVDVPDPVFMQPPHITVVRFRPYERPLEQMRPHFVKEIKKKLAPPPRGAPGAPPAAHIARVFPHTTKSVGIPNASELASVAIGQREPPLALER